MKSVLGAPCKIDITLEDAETRQTVEIPSTNSTSTGSTTPTEILPLFISNETISGTVKIQLENNTKKIEHTGIRLQLVGVISKLKFPAKILLCDINEHQK